MIKKNLFLIALALLLAFSTSAFAGESADRINEKIAEMGLSWHAADNEVARLHRELGWYSSEPLASVDLGMEMQPFKSTTKDDELPAMLDWRDMDGANYVTRVKNQLSCGSCWAFATAGPMESAIAIAEGWTDPLLDLSEQQLVSCSSAGSCSSGGLTTASFNFAVNPGLTREECFTYKASDNPSCGDVCDVWADEGMLYKIDDWQTISLTGFNIEGMKQALQTSPIAASLVIFEDFYEYASGIYEPTTLKMDGLHAVTIVGYNAEEEYWIAKNSWGPNWGDHGFFKIKFGAALIGSMSILPVYEGKNLGPEPDPPVFDDDDDTDDDDSVDDDVADDDDEVDDDDDTQDGDDDDDDDSCGG